jgi:RNA binding exosome subunit
MKVHHITVSAFCDPKAAPGLRETLMKILPADAEIEEKAIEPETEGGVFTKELVELRARLDKQPQMNDFAAKLLAGLDEYDKKKVIEGLESSIDDECNLYIRLSKAEAAAGAYVLEGKDPIHVTFKIAAYPAKKEKAVEAAREFIKDGTP